MCTARDRAAMFNAEYKELIKEFVAQYKVYSGEHLQSIIQGLLEKTLLLVYMQENASDVEKCKDEYSNFYSPDTRGIGTSTENIMAGIISGDKGARLIIRETYFARNCKIKRYLPIVTAFLIMNGKSVLDDERFKIVQNSAFWIFGLNSDTDPDIEQKMRENGIWITDILTEDDRKPVADKSEEGGLILEKYKDILKAIFPQYMEKRVAKLELEIQVLQKQSVKTSLHEQAPET